MSDETTQLRDELEAVRPLVADADRLRRENQQLREQLGRARARIDVVTLQRDRQRYTVLKMRASRPWRVLAAIRKATRSRYQLLRLPLTLLRIVFGPAPALPPEPGTDTAAPSEDTGKKPPTALRSAVERPSNLALRRRFVAPPAPVTTQDLRVAGILDTFSEASFAPECALDTRFRPDNWQETLETHQPHLLLVESAWKGNGGSWEYQVGSYSYPDAKGLPHLSALTDWCREQGIVTVFWNKEDPVHFDKFKEAASRFDVVLTTDADRIEAYGALPDRRAEVIAALPFAAQPRIHHPVGAPDPREPFPVFAGTYYRNRHEDRRAQLEMILDAARPHGLRIFDRTAGVKNDSTGFPDRFDPHVQGGLPYDEMVEAYRRYRVFLNTNSVTASPTMFSRRVFELLASGTPVISTPSVGMEAMLGSVVRTVRTPEEADAAITELMTDDAVWRTTSRAGLRLVLSEHTMANRLSTIARACGLELPPGGGTSLTALVLDDGGLPRARLGTAMEASLPGSGALVGSSRDADGPTVHPLVRTVHQRGDATVGGRIAELADLAETPWVLVTSGTEDELALAADLVAARRYAEAEVYGIGAEADAGRVDAYVRELAPTPLLIRRDLASRLPTTVDGAGRADALAAAGARCFAVDGGSAA